MKPKLKSMRVEFEYWACGDPHHHHKTEPVAAECIRKRLSKSPAPDYAQRSAKIFAEYRSGASPCDIARELGMSKQRVSVLINKKKRMERARKWHEFDNSGIHQEDSMSDIVWSARNYISELGGDPKYLADQLVYLT